MPFYSSTSSAGSDVAPISTGLSDLKITSLPSAPVTSVTRPLTKPEQWSLWNFENHAFHCNKCNNPYSVIRKGDSLCREGKAFADQITSFLSSKNSGRDVYDIDAAAPLRVEMPYGYTQVHSLLRAAERTARHERQRQLKPVVTHGSSPRSTTSRRSSIVVAESTSNRRNSMVLPLSLITRAQDERPSRRQRSPESHRSTSRRAPERKVEIVDWPESEVAEQYQPVPGLTRAPSVRNTDLPRRRETLVRNTSSRDDNRRHTVMLTGDYNVAVRRPKYNK